MLWRVERCSGKEAGGRGATHHCVAGFITWSLTGLFLPHLCPTFWDFLSTYDPGGWTREQHRPESKLGLFELTIWWPHTLNYGPEVEHGPGGQVDLTPMTRTWLEEMLVEIDCGVQ